MANDEDTDVMEESLELEGDIPEEDESVIDEPAAEETPEPEPLPLPISPVRKLHAVSLEVFMKLSGTKWDQMAGFKRYAIKQNLKTLTVPEWREAYSAFLKRPTR